MLLRLPSGVYKHIKITPTAYVPPPVTALTRRSNIPLGKYGSFKAKDLIGKPFGETYEIKAGLLHVVQTTLNEIGTLLSSSRVPWLTSRRRRDEREQPEHPRSGRRHALVRRD